MKKINIIKYLSAWFRRDYKDEHFFEVVVYLDGKIVERVERRVLVPPASPLCYSVLHWANCVVSELFGHARRKRKGRA